MVKVAVLGMGSIGTRHARLLSRMPNVVLTCVPSRPERVSEISIDGARVAASIDEALQAGQDGVLIATDSGRHAADSIVALMAGAHILIEKPAATNGPDALKIREVAIATGRRAHVACCLRFDSGLRWIAERIADIGPVIIADAECLSWLPGWRPDRDYRASYSSRVGEGGVLLDLIHEIDYCSWLLGPLRLAGAVRGTSGLLNLAVGLEETAVIVAVAAGATPVTIRLSYLVRSERRSLRILGQDGELEWDAVARVASHRKPDGVLVDQMSWETADTMYERQLIAWVSSLDGLVAPDLVEIDEGIAAVQFCDAVRLRADVCTGVESS